MPEIPSLRHRRLTIELRRLRKASGLTREQVAAQLEWAGSKVTRIETGDWKRLHPHDVVRMLDVYGVTDETEQERYATLARRARERRWWNDYADIAADYTAFEDEATTIQTYEPSSIPGLLQTEDYARGIIQADPAVEHDEVERRVAVRMERQRQKPLLEADGPQFWVIIDEAAVRRPVGDDKVMAEQLRHLLRAASVTPRINLQVLPFSAGAHPGMNGSFVILRFAEPFDWPIVYLETATDGLYPEGQAAIERYTLMFDHLRAMALHPRESVTFLEDAIPRL